MSDSIAVETHKPCDDCGSSDALSVYSDGHSYCFSCLTWFPPPKENGHAPQHGTGPFTFEYLPLRGINRNSLEFYNVKSKINKDGEPLSIDFIYPNGSHKVRDLQVKSFWTELGPNREKINDAGLFGRDRFSAGGCRSVTITEGEIDAISLWQALGSNLSYAVCSVQSSSSAHRDCSLDRAWLNSFEKIYIAFDGDEHGRRASDQVAKLFDPAKVYHVKFTKRKDANEYLAAGEGEELKRIWWNSKIYLPDNVISHVQDFKDILDKEPVMGFPFPWKKLTEMTYGLPEAGTVLLTAQEKVGKTELFHFIEHSLLRAGNNVAAIFLETQPRRHLQALASIELKRPCHIPDSGVSKADRDAAIDRVVGVDNRLFIYSHYGSDDPDILLDRIRYFVTAHHCKYVMFDNITVSVSGLGEEKTTQILDYLSTKLEMLTKELDFCLLFISHLNDFGQTRGSRNLGKICDLRIDVTRDLQATSDMDKRTWELNLAYARWSGKSGPAGRIVYNPDTYSFTELLDLRGDNDNVRDAVRSAA